MGVIRADQLADAGRRLARVFVDGFGHRLTYFSKDPVRLVAAFAHMFRTDCFFVAIEDGAVAAMAGITDGNEPAVELNAAHLRRKLGLLRGSIAAAVLDKTWRRGYPIPRHHLHFRGRRSRHRGGRTLRESWLHRIGQSA